MKFSVVNPAAPAISLVPYNWIFVLLLETSNNFVLNEHILLVHIEMYCAMPFAKYYKTEELVEHHNL